MEKEGNGERKRGREREGEKKGGKRGGEEGERQKERSYARREKRLSIREEGDNESRRETLMALERRAEERKWLRLGSAAFVPGCAAWYEQSADSSQEGMCIAG